ncbi:MAG: zinc-dependent metalloprotease [Anaeromyxobacteraceae bacterium]
MTTGCGGSASAPEGAAAPGVLDGSAFVAVPRDLGTSAASQLRSGQLRSLASSQLAAGESFYLAIKRSELSRRYFLSAYVEQVNPFGVEGGAASSVGTRVVSFKIQNDKLFLFDASDVNTISDVFDPTLVLEAWPLVTASDKFNKDQDRDKYVLIDPAAGLNRFSLFADYLYQPPQFKVGLSYLQGFKKLADGVAFQQVFTGEASAPIHDWSGAEINLNRVSGTLGIALREYKEGAGFTPGALPSQEYFFRSWPRLVPNTGGEIQTPVKWNVKPGMKPIRWTISPYVKKLAADPFYGRYDIAGAVKRGVENWNAAFGFKVLEAVVGDDAATPGDDATNFIYLDVNPALGFAFADWRTNPNSGEIRGASVYLNTIWVDIGSFLFDPDAWNARPQKPDLFAAAPKAKFRFGWNGMNPETLCEFPISPLLGEDLATVSSKIRVATAPAVNGRTGIRMVEDYVAGVVLHEIGHTLGLRHNFKGSLVPPSSSIMEYIDDFDQVNVFTPQSYDVAAVKLLYGLSADEPADPFCTDEDTQLDPDCTRFDVGADPLNEFFGPIYLDIVGTYLTDPTFPFVPGSFVTNSLLAYARAGATSATRQLGFLYATAYVTGQEPPPSVAIPSRVNAWSGFVNRRLFLDPASARTSGGNAIVNDPPVGTDAGLNAAFLAEEGGWLRNTNGVTSFASRRTAVDVLKKVQITSAYLELLAARGDILGGFPAPAVPDALTADLLARIDVAVTPYFK